MANFVVLGKFLINVDHIVHIEKTGLVPYCKVLFVTGNYAELDQNSYNLLVREIAAIKKRTVGL